MKLEIYQVGIIESLMREPSRGVVNNNSFLLKKYFLRYISKQEKATRKQGRDGVADTFKDLLRLLTLCKELGVDEGFEKYESSTEGLNKLLHQAIRVSGEYSNKGGDDAKLDAAASLWRRVLSHPKLAESPKRLAALRRGGTILLMRYKNREDRGDRADLDRSIEVLGSGVAAASKERSEGALLLYNLGAALHARYLLTRWKEDLNGAIHYLQDSLELASTDQEEYAEILADLGNALCCSHERTGSISDLDEAITHLEKAAGMVDDKAAGGANVFISLGAAIHDRYKRKDGRSDLERSRDLERSIDLHWKGVEQASESSPERLSGLINISLLLKDRYQLSPNDEDLENAMRCIRDAQRLILEESPHRSALLVNLQNVLIKYFELTEEPEILKDALRTSEAALASSPKGSQHRATILFAYSEARRISYEHFEKAGDIEAARHAFREASQIGVDLAPAHTLEASRQWAIWELGQENWQGAVEAGVYGLQSIEHLLGGQVLRRHKESWLRDAQGLTTTVAYAQAKIGQYDQALSILENGQARLLSEALESNRRDLPSLSIERLCDITAIAPLVYILVTRAGGLALVVESTGTSAVFLDSFTVEDFSKIALGKDGNSSKGYLRAYLEWRENPSAEARSIWHDSIESTTQWLYESAMQQVLAALEGHKRAILIPCGVLTLLPFHAAWIEDPESPQGRRYALDEMCFTYAPNARSVLSAQKKKSSMIERLLAIEEPQPVSASSLPWAKFEIAAVCDAFQAIETCKLIGRSAEKEALKNELENATFFHFAGHASASPSEPLKSSLILANDENLTVGDLLAMPSSRVRLAVLSACETAFPGTDLLDEAIGLPTALLQADVAGIIASLWMVADASTALLMARFYKNWRGKEMSPPEALRDAQRWIRNASRNDIVEWYDKQGHDIRVQLSSQPLPRKEHPFSHPFYWAAFTFTGLA